MPNRFSRARLMAAFLPPGHPLVTKGVLGPRDLEAEVLLRLGREADPGLHGRLRRTLGDAGYRFPRLRELGGGDIGDLLCLQWRKAMG